MNTDRNTTESEATVIVIGQILAQMLIGAAMVFGAVLGFSLRLMWAVCVGVLAGASTGSGQVRVNGYRRSNGWGRSTQVRSYYRGSRW